MMSARATIRSTLLICALLLQASVVNALDITDGDVVVRNLGSYGFTAGSSFLSFDSGATDQLYQMYGYLGNANGVVAVRNANFNVVSAIAGSGATATSTVDLDPAGATALGLAAGDVRIQYTFGLVDDTGAADADGFTWDVSLTNLSSGVLDLVFYSYLDLDLDGAGDYADDTAVANVNRIVVSDSSPTSTTQFVWLASGAGAADHFEVQAYPATRNLLNGMGSAGDLSDSLSNFGPDDFSAAFQYNLSLAAGASVNLGLGAIATAPEPGTAVLLILGLAGLHLAGSQRSRRHARRAENRTRS